jgi:hypothetical protein
VNGYIGLARVVLPVVFTVACAEVPPAEPRAPEPVFHGLPAAALPKPPPDFRGFICFLAENTAPTTRIQLDVSGTIVVPGETPVFDPKLTPDTWAEGTCTRMLAEGCVCTAETADTIRSDLATCAGDLSGVLTLRFSAAEEDPEHALPRTAVIDVAIDALTVGSTRYGFVQGVVATTDGVTFTTARPFSTPDTPILPERATAPQLPQQITPQRRPQPSAFGRAYRGVFWMLQAIGCLARSRC